MCKTFLFAFLSLMFFLQGEETKLIKLNTSNKGKFQEFQRLFDKCGYHIEATNIDLKEIESDPITVVTHKASQLDEETLVEDTSLDIEGADVGINVRWLLDNLKALIGKKAYWRVLLAYRQGKNVNIYQGTVVGTIVEPRGEGGFGFDPVFQPEGSNFTLAESKPDSHNARAKAVQAFCNKEIFAIRPIIEKWEGQWQAEH